MATQQSLQQPESPQPYVIDGFKDDPKEVPSKRSSGLLPYIQIARIDHWIKNFFMLFGVLLAYFIEPGVLKGSFAVSLCMTFLLVGLVCSSNYVINEILDARFDRFHPDKRSRPIPSGAVKIPVAYLEWLLLGAAGISGLFLINRSLGFSGLALWIMGIVYNVRPIRTKELPYLDVLSESVNNPIRLLLGWFVLLPEIVPPVSLLIAYWMLGAFFMALKRFAEYRRIAKKRRALLYRRSFAYYNEERLLVSLFCYAVFGSLFAGIFTVRYHLELILFFPFAVVFLGLYLQLGFRKDSPVQSPEKLYQEKGLVITGMVSLVVFLALMLTSIPVLYDVFNVERTSHITPLWTLD